MTKIVFIDSDNFIRESYAHLLEAGGYQVLQATTAQYGMWLCREFTPDLVITTREPVDSELETGDFVDAVRQAASGTPVVVVCHEGRDADAAAFAAETSSDPHTYVELMNAIHKALDDGIGEMTIRTRQTGEGAVNL